MCLWKCFFRGFDYGAIGPDGQHHIIKRTSESAFLTSHLRSYGGAGIYQNYKIGRVLRKITFSGKGFVDKPANPNSIIFVENSLRFSNASSVNPFSKEDVYFFVNNAEKESVSMANEEKLLEDQINELKASLKELQTENVTLKDQLAQANVKEFEIQIATLTTENTQLKTDLASAKSEFDKTNAELAGHGIRFRDNLSCPETALRSFAGESAAEAGAEGASGLVRFLTRGEPYRLGARQVTIETQLARVGRSGSSHRGRVVQVILVRRVTNGASCG